MKKEKLLVSSLIILSILFGPASLVIAAQPGAQPSGKPFEALRQDVTQLQEDVSVLRVEVLQKDKSGIWQAISELQNRVATLEDEVIKLWDKVKSVQDEIVVLTERVLNLETWKVTIEEWKTSIVAWQSNIENQIATLDDKITSEVARLDKKIDDAVATLEAKISDLATDLNTKITALMTRVTDLENPNILLEKIKQVDGSGSGLDADMVDGKHASELLPLWTDVDGYIYPNNIGTNFQITDTGNLYIPGNVSIGMTGSGYGILTIPRTDYNAHPLALDAHKPNIDVDLVFTEMGIPQWEFSKRSNNKFTLWRRGLGDIISVMPDTGNVGIGTISPGQKLTVAGVIESTSGGHKISRWNCSNICSGTTCSM